MKAKALLITLLSILLCVALAGSAVGEKKKVAKRGMLESMQSVPCGAKERGLTGLGSVFGSVGVQHVNSHEQLCPQYLLRTDEMDYHIRPKDTKHAAVLPVGHEAEFKVKKDRMYLKMVDGDKKSTEFEVVAMQPASAEDRGQSAQYHPADKPSDRGTDSRPPAKSGDNGPPPPSNSNNSNEGNKNSDPAKDNPPNR